MTGRFVGPVDIDNDLAQSGLQSLHHYPHVAGEDSIIVGRRRASEAWATFPKLQVNPENSVSVLVVDVDKPDHRWDGGQFPIAPNWIVVNTRAATKQKRAGGLHAAYCLEDPVTKHDASRLKPQQFLGAIADRLALFVGSDPGYSGHLSRNPVNPGPECFTHWSNFVPFTLDELDRRLPAAKTLPGQRLTGIGRNVDLFTAMIIDAHRPRWARAIAGEGWGGEWLGHVRHTNIGMWAPSELPDSECRSIARSCARYSLRQYSEDRFKALQTQRNGKRWHDDFDFDFDARDSVLRLLLDSGFKQREMAALMGVGIRQLQRIIQKSKKATSHNS